MPINHGDEYLIKAKDETGKYQIVGNINVGEYGPRITLKKDELLIKLFENTEANRRMYFPVFIWNKKEATEVVESEEDDA